MRVYVEDEVEGNEYEAEKDDGPGRVEERQGD